MATIASPRKRLRIGRAPLIIGGIIIIAALIGTALITLRQPAAATQAATPGWETVAVQPGTINATVSATGNVEAKAEADLRFASEGTISEVLVRPGDTITAGQPLARIDASDLQLTVEQRAADLKESQASLQELRDGATPAEIADAQAAIARARGSYNSTVGSVSQADIGAARATLEEARARLARLSSGAAPEDRADAEAQLQQAVSALDESHATLASTKETARLEMERTANELRNKQDEFSKIYWDNRQLEGYGKLPQDAVDQEAAAKRAVEDAETALNQKRIAYDEARQNEIATLQTREADVRKAQVNLDKVLAGPRAEDLAEARASVQQAQAELNKLTGANRSGDVAAAQADIDAAQAQFEKLTADPAASALAKAEAVVARSEASLKQAQRDLEQATLVAPFNATVARVEMEVGERAADATIAIADISGFHVDVPVDELDVAQLTAGQTVQVSFDALPDNEIEGKVRNIAPLATANDKGTTTYEVTVDLDPGDAALRSGMTAVVQIVTRSKTDALLVPRRAVQSENGQSYVLVPTTGAADPVTGQPANERRNVAIGLTNTEFVEVTSGINAGDKVLVADVVQIMDTGVN